MAAFLALNKNLVVGGEAAMKTSSQVQPPPSHHKNPTPHIHLNHLLL